MCYCLVVTMTLILCLFFVSYESFESLGVYVSDPIIATLK